MRSPVCSVLGHVDHGKSSLLDRIRGTAITAKEAGGITQAIGASIIPIATVKKICGPLLEKLHLTLTIPGLLFVDTPGHAAFTSLRKRGGSLSDIAVLVVDINEGFKPQTVEAIQILKACKTPFIIAANKIDVISGWRSGNGMLLPSLAAQQETVKELFETKLYELVGQLFDQSQLPGERFDRVDDFTKTVAIVPCSAKTGEGIPELLMVISGLAQRFLEQSLKVGGKEAKGTILEVKEEKGLGKTLDVILYEGSLKAGDTIVIGALGKPVVTKVRGLFEPAPLAEMRDKKAKFMPVKEVHAATGVKIVAPDIDLVVSGMPLWSATKETLEHVTREIQKEVESVIIETEEEGIILKADSLGSLEALMTLLKGKTISLRKATIGDVTKKDIIDAESNADELQRVILCFNLNPTDEIKALSSKVKIIAHNVIYQLVDDYTAWLKEKSQQMEEGQLDTVIKPCKIRLMPGYVFRQSNPAVVGGEILLGTAKSNTPLMLKDGVTLTSIRGMQKEKENVSEARKGAQLAFSLDNVTVGRQIKEGDILYSAISEADFRKMKELKKYLKPDEAEAAKEIANLMREKNPVWGI